MGIYYGNELKGIRFIEGDEGKVIYENNYDHVMTKEEIEEEKKRYNEIKDTGYKSQSLYIQVFLECTMTYDNPPTTGWMWVSVSLDDL